MTVLEQIVQCIRLRKGDETVFLVDLKSRVPIYEQLKKNTLELIMREVLMPGDKMPSVRSLATDLGINPNTVQKAYQDMEKEGIIYTVAGRGSFVSDDIKEKNLNVDDAIGNLKKSVNEAHLYGVRKEEIFRIVEDEYGKE